MPEINYANGKIYKVESPNTDKIYIGSTVQSLAKRFHLHNRKNNTTSSKEIIDAGNAKITLVQLYPCDSKKELFTKEREIIDNEPNCINKYSPIISDEEFKKQKRASHLIWQKTDKGKACAKRNNKKWSMKNKDKCLEYVRRFQHNNPERIKQYRKNWYENKKKNLKDLEIKLEQMENEMRQEQMENENEKLERLKQMENEKEILEQEFKKEFPTN